MNPIKFFLKTILLKPLYNLLIFVMWLVPGHSVGFAIIVLTLLVRLILLPSSLKALRIQKKMQDLSPELARLREQHKQDKKAQAQAIFDLHKRHGVNPAGSCLLNVVQIPVIVILYYVFRIGLNAARFDLLYQFTPRPEHFNSMFLGIDLSKPEHIVLPVLVAASQFFLARITPMATGGSEDETTRLFSLQFRYVFPLLFAYISVKLPAALPVYWVTSNLFGIAQQLYINRASPAIAAVATPSSPSLPAAGEQQAETIAKKGVTITVRKKAK